MWIRVNKTFHISKCQVHSELTRKTWVQVTSFTKDFIVLKEHYQQFGWTGTFKMTTTKLTIAYQKSNNLQYNTLCRWVDGKIISLTKCLMFQVLFLFVISCKVLCKNPFNYFFYNFTKIKIKSFECPKSIRNYEKKIMLGTSDVWSLSSLSQRAIIL